MTEKSGRRKEKRIVKIAVPYRRARQPSERRPTGTPTARANFIFQNCTLFDLAEFLIIIVIIIVKRAATMKIYESCLLYQIC